MPKLTIDRQVESAAETLNRIYPGRWRLERGISQDVNFGLVGLSWISLVDSEGNPGPTLWVVTPQEAWLSYRLEDSALELAEEWWGQHRLQRLPDVLVALCSRDYSISNSNGVARIDVATFTFDLHG